MHYDTQIIYGSIDRKQFTWNGWIYYRTPTGKTKRTNGVVIEKVNEGDFVNLKATFENVMGYKVEC